MKATARKVTDNLSIFKNDRKTIKVEQKYVHGKKGSYHVITADWNLVIDLYSKYNTKASGSIRFHKSIKYRIISLLRTTIKSFSSALADLMQSQKNKYLKNLIQFDLQNFKDTKYILKYILGKHKEIIFPEYMNNTKYIVSNYNHPELVIEAKSEVLYKELSKAASYLIPEFKDNYSIELSLLASS
ncbi:hypothetical protein RJI07_08570 [Mycoplasmatota bacterium WC30]